MWGMLADRFGRRPVLLIGLLGSAVAPIIFGMAESLPVALGARLMDGFFCGNIGVVRTYLGETVDGSNEVKAFGILASTFSLGLIIGPMLGGSLAYPARWYPATFQGTIFDTHPFLLANLSYACLAVAALLLGFIALPESRGRAQQVALLTEAREVESSESQIQSQRLKFWQGFPKGRHFRYTLCGSSLLFGYTAARLNSFVLVSSLPADMGGMALSPHQFGYIQVCAAAMIFLNQLTLYPALLRRFGPQFCFAVALGWTVVITLPIPLYYMVADPRFHFWRYVPITAWQMLTQFGLSTCFPVSVMLVNRRQHIADDLGASSCTDVLNEYGKGFRLVGTVEQPLRFNNLGFDDNMVGLSPGSQNVCLLAAFGNGGVVPSECVPTLGTQAPAADEFNGRPEQHYFGMEGFDCGYNFMPFEVGPHPAVPCCSSLEWAEQNRDALHLAFANSLGAQPSEIRVDLLPPGDGRRLLTQLAFNVRITWLLGATNSSNRSSDVAVEELALLADADGMSRFGEALQSELNGTDSRLAGISVEALSTEVIDSYVVPEASWILGSWDTAACDAGCGGDAMEVAQVTCVGFVDFAHCSGGRLLLLYVAEQQIFQMTLKLSEDDRQ
eukprot:Skav208099  [mRNA]  locus=scaffold1681:224923:240091:- [translate_table: standard]